MNMKFDRALNVKHFEQEIDSFYSNIIKKIREENPYNEHARYWINVSDTISSQTRFCLGDRPLNQYNPGELTRILFKICQSNEDFAFRKFILDVFLYES